MSPPGGGRRCLAQPAKSCISPSHRLRSPRTASDGTRVTSTVTPQAARPRLWGQWLVNLMQRPLIGAHWSSVSGVKLRRKRTVALYSRQSGLASEVCVRGGDTAHLSTAIQEPCTASTVQRAHISPGSVCVQVVSLSAQIHV